MTVHPFHLDRLAIEVIVTARQTEFVLIPVIVLFIVLKILFSFIIAILNKIANLPIISTVNRLGGLLVGAINGVLIVYIGILLINWLPLEALNSIRLEVNSSIAGAAINSMVPEVATEVISLVDIAALSEKE